MSVGNPNNLNEITEQVDQMESILDDLEDIATDNNYQDVEDLTYEFRDEVDQLLDDFERVENAWQTYDRNVREHVADWIDRLENLEDTKQPNPGSNPSSFGGYWPNQNSMYQQQNVANGFINQTQGFANPWTFNQNNFMNLGFNNTNNFWNNQNYNNQEEGQTDQNYEDFYNNDAQQTNGFVQMSQSMNGQMWQSQFFI